MIAKTQEKSYKQNFHWPLEISQETSKKLAIFEELIYERKATFPVINEVIQIYSVS